MKTTKLSDANSDEGFAFATPDELHQLLLLEIAHNLGLPTYGQSLRRRRVRIYGSKTEADTFAATARRLAAQLHPLQLKALREVLVKNRLQPSRRLAECLAMAESRVAAVQAQPHTELRSSPRRVNRRWFLCL